jgi:hypothetical protein
VIQDWIKRQSISGGTINKNNIYIEIQRCTRVVTTWLYMYIYAIIKGDYTCVLKYNVVQGL